MLIDMLVFMCYSYVGCILLCILVMNINNCLAMLSVVEPKDGRAYVEYTEFRSKNNPGGLKV